MIVVVSDTSPVRELNYLGMLDTLGELFDQVLIPPSVLHELAFPSTRFDPIDVSRYKYMELRAARDVDQVSRFMQTLDAGEAEALAIAIEVEPHALLIDEEAGRAVAKQSGIPVLGTLGVLLRAKRQGQIVRIGPLIERLSDELNFYMSDQLKADILRSAGE